jgi:hypothetical protein
MLRAGTIQKNRVMRRASPVSHAPDRIRTCDLCLRRAALYPTELRARQREANKPSFVTARKRAARTISLGRRLLAGSSSRPGTDDGAGSTSSLLGLAPGGVCLAAHRYRERGGLLPHRFTLACDALPRPSAVFSLLHFPSSHDARPLAGTLPCGARTFLDRLEAGRGPHSLPEI